MGRFTVKKTKDNSMSEPTNKRPMKGSCWLRCSLVFSPIMDFDYGQLDFHDLFLFTLDVVVFEVFFTFFVKQAFSNLLSKLFRDCLL